MTHFKYLRHRLKSSTNNEGGLTGASDSAFDSKFPQILLVQSLHLQLVLVSPCILQKYEWHFENLARSVSCFKTRLPIEFRFLNLLSRVNYFDRLQNRSPTVPLKV